MAYPPSVRALARTDRNPPGFCAARKVPCHQPRAPWVSVTRCQAFPPLEETPSVTRVRCSGNRLGGRGRRSHRDVLLLARADVTSEVGGEPVVQLQHRERLEVLGVDGVGHEPPLRVGPRREAEGLGRTPGVQHHAVRTVARRHLVPLHVRAVLVGVDERLALVDVQLRRCLAPGQEAAQAHGVAVGAPVLDVPGHVVLPPGVVDPEGVAEAGPDGRSEPVESDGLAEVIGVDARDHRPRQRAGDVLGVRLDPLLTGSDPLHARAGVPLELVVAERRAQRDVVPVAGGLAGVDRVVGRVDLRQVALGRVVDQRLVRDVTGILARQVVDERRVLRLGDGQAGALLRPGDQGRTGVAVDAGDREGRRAAVLGADVLVQAAETVVHHDQGERTRRRGRGGTLVGRDRVAAVDDRDLARDLQARVVGGRSLAGVHGGDGVRPHAEPATRLRERREPDVAGRRAQAQHRPPLAPPGGEHERAVGHRVGG